MPYDHQSLEKKWQDFWKDSQTFQAPTLSDKPKKYILDMFPYPSGAGLHVGHPKGYTATDIISRYYHAKGYNVLHPMGFDAFGLPAENYAIKTGTHPRVTTAENIATFTDQLQKLGFSYDWSRMVDTTDPEYYRWTQWIFLELFKRWLAYEQDLPINYCPSCKTGLANEEVLSDNTCDRCGTRVERKPIRQWVLKITEYADRLLADLDSLDWPEGIKEMQRNWIGRSEGCEFELNRDMSRDKKNGICISASGVGLNCPAKFPFLDTSIFKTITKVKKKNEILREIDVTVFQREKKIILNSSHIFKHFLSKDTKEFRYRRSLLSVVYVALTDIHFHENIWYCIFKDFVIKVVLGQQSNGNHFVKTYYVDDRMTDLYRESLREESSRDESRKVPSLRVYTTRIDTVFGMTYVVMAPDHPDVYRFITDDQREECEQYILDSKKKSDQDRTNENKEKTGVFTGSYVINPYNGNSVPLWIADYVLGNYGTGAVMAVPAHDERDFEFAKKYGLEIKQSICEFTQYTGISKIRPEKETLLRRTIDVIFENEKWEILLEIEKDGDSNHIHLLGGGIEEWDSELETVAKEILEESGYTDIEIISPLPLSYKRSVGYRHTKDKNQDCTGRCFHVKLLSGNQISSEIEEWKHSIQWVKKEEVFELITWSCHKDWWNIFYTGEKCYTEDWSLINSWEYDGLTSLEARRVLTEKAETEGFGKKKVNYKLRDWLFSRQRYWGEPIPLIHLDIADLQKLPHITDISQAVDPSHAYILKRDPIEWERCEGVSCKCGHIRELIIDGKVFSKIYDGINSKIIIDSRLPLTLPAVEKYEPAGDGQSPLATVESFVNIQLAENLSGRRETNTMPQWWGSCWYYLRYMDPHNREALASREALDYWGMVDEYVGGAEHAVLHLLYARFWHKVLFDLGVVPTTEPFHKLTNVGLILAYAYERASGGLVAVDQVEEVSNPPVKGGGEAWGFASDKKIFIEKSTGEEVKQVVAKMSKSLKNVINPNDIVAEYGADTLRLYEMSMGAFTDSAPWNPEAIIGSRRFLDKVYSAFGGENRTSGNPPVKGGSWSEAEVGGFASERKQTPKPPLTGGQYRAKDDMKAMKLLHKTIKKVGEDIVEYKFNTAISSLIILMNEWIPSDEEMGREWKIAFLTMLHPFAPHMAEELYQLTVGNGQSSIYSAPWPEYDEWMLVDDEVNISIQVNGKLRGVYQFMNGVAQQEVSIFVREQAEIQKWLDGKELVKEIWIPNKMLSIVVR